MNVSVSMVMTCFAVIDLAVVAVEFVMWVLLGLGPIHDPSPCGGIRPMGPTREGK